MICAVAGERRSGESPSDGAISIARRVNFTALLDRGASMILANGAWNIFLRLITNFGSPLGA
jgi:hypothetical protein